MDLSGCWPQLWSLICRPRSSMTARRIPTIGDRLPVRTCWADLADSSQDCSRDDSHLVPRAPTVDDSYDAPAVGVDSKGGLNSMLSRAALNKGPIDFTFLLNGEGKNASQSFVGFASPTSPTPGDSTASSSHGPTPSAQQRQLDPSASAFVPKSSPIEWGGACLRQQPSSPSMPPPAVPQAAAKSRRIRGKRALSNLQKDSSQAPAVKRPKEYGRDRLNSCEAGDMQRQSTPQQRANLPSEPPPPATEEEWQHRIAKRIKVVTSMKETREYQGYFAKRTPAARLHGEPRTPTAEDRSLSKRRWEYEIQQWRTQLKQWAVDNLPPEEADTMQLEEALSPSMEAED